MKYLSIRDLRGNTAAVRKSLATEGEIVVTSSGKPIAVLAPVSPDSVEETVTAIRRARFSKAPEKLVYARYMKDFKDITQILYQIAVSAGVLIVAF